MIGQSRLKDSPFKVIDCSLQAAPIKTREEKAREAIKRADVMIVMVGSSTYKAPGVLKEVGMAHQEEIQIVQMIGFRDSNYTAVPNAGRLYSWNRPNLKALLN